MDNIRAKVQDISHDGEAIIHVNNRTYFVDGALTGETILFKPWKKHKGNYQGKLIGVIQSSADRVVPPCDYFGVCGGCVLQHYKKQAQVDYKQKLLIENLWRIGKVEAQTLLPPLASGDWGYRRRARLGVKYVPAKGGVIVGFRERKNSFITPLQNCLVLDSRITTLLPSLATTIAELSGYQTIPQIEVAAADNAVAIIIRHLKALNLKDEQVLRQYAQQENIQVFLQSAGLDSITQLPRTQTEALYYRLIRHDVRIYFLVSDFIQVNANANALLVDEVLKHLMPCKQDNILDLFCGLGNFSLPIAKTGANVLAIEGDQGLVSRATENAKMHGLYNVQFQKNNLFKDSISHYSSVLKTNKVLLDPPRAGAWEVVSQAIPEIKPTKIVYVSCNPATLARDAEALIRQGYTLTNAGIIDMFPHTAHVESIAIFVK